MSESKSKSRVERPEWAPKMEFFAKTSKDGKYDIFQTIITVVKHRNYLDTIRRSQAPAPHPKEAEAASSAPEEAGS